jgi:hypothetical protein
LLLGRRIANPVPHLAGMSPETVDSFNSLKMGSLLKKTQERENRNNGSRDVLG